MPNTSKPIETVILVHVNLQKQIATEEELQEFKELAQSAGAKVISIIVSKRDLPDAKYFIGSGKAEEIRHQVITLKPSLIIFDHALSPAQERNLEKILQCRVLDRTGLILDIFAQRARTFEGKLQVRLAQLQHLSARLVRGWTHLERQRGGIGLRGGPGETQLEIDRRVIKQKIVSIEKQLEKVRQQRKLGQRARKKALIPTVALIGYTNAGKSTLFNVLTKADVYVANKLFATLDPTLRRIEFDKIGTIILADTVGFIRQLPHELVESFRATLEETKDADLLLHVVDAHDPLHLEKIKAVNEVLAAIGGEKVPQLLIYNKIDLLAEPKNQPHLDFTPHKKITRIWLSAKSSEGIDVLQNALQDFFISQFIDLELCLLANKDASIIRSSLYDYNAITFEEIDVLGNYHLKLHIRPSDLAKIFKL